MPDSRERGRSWRKGRWTTSRALLAAVVVIVSCQRGSSQPNCSNTYLLSPSPDAYTGCCVQLSPPLPTAGSCSTIMEILSLHNGTIPAGDCLQLTFSPGLYHLPSLSQVLVRYSVVMTAPQGGVEVACGEGEGQGCGEGGGGAQDREDEAVIVAMMVFNGTQRENMFVNVEGIRFSNCTKQLQFDELTSLSINNCTFT